MVDQPHTPKISHSDGDLQKHPPSQISSAMSAKSSELNNSDQKILVVHKNLTSISEENIVLRGYCFAKVVS